MIFLDPMFRFSKLTGRCGVALIAMLLVSACGSTTPPTAPAPPVTPAGQFTLSGTVTKNSGGGIAGALVAITAGANAGKNATTDASGRYSLTGLVAGTLTLTVTAQGFAAQTTSVTMANDQSADFSLAVAVFLTNGRAVDALTQAPYPGLTVSIDGAIVGTTDGSGAFTLNTNMAFEAPRLAVFSGPGIVERRTNLKIPGGDVSAKLISSSFDLAAFNEMFRVPMLLRWTTAPPLLIETRALQFTATGAPDQTALADQMSADEVNDLVADLTWALPQMTGGAFSGFAGVTTQTSAQGSVVHLLNTGVITVSRVVGLTQSAGYWGYSRWEFRSDGTIYGGMVTLDRDFERSGSPYRRSLRTHELGHALGYNHVTVRPSVMNSAARIEPNAFDLDACRIGFARPPGNRAPDNDPASSSLNRRSLTLTWSAPIR
jgi:hypothetical protein